MLSYTILDVNAKDCPRMTIDDYWWDIHEDLKIQLEREPTYEEVQEHIEGMYKITKEEEIEYNYRKIYGK